MLGPKAIIPTKNRNFLLTFSIFTLGVEIINWNFEELVQRFWRWMSSKLEFGILILKKRSWRVDLGHSLGRGPRVDEARLTGQGWCGTGPEGPSAWKWNLSNPLWGEKRGPLKPFVCKDAAWWTSSYGLSRKKPRSTPLRRGPILGIQHKMANSRNTKPPPPLYY